MLFKLRHATAITAVILSLCGCMKAQDEVYLLAEDSRSGDQMGARAVIDPTYFTGNATESKALLEVPNYGDLTLDEVVEIIKSHSVQRWLPMSTVWHLKTANDNPLDHETILGGRALPSAAAAYAVHTLDFHVTLRDLIDSGYWPYLLLPANVDLDATVSAELGGAISGEGENFDGAMFHQLGSPEWVLRRKAIILGLFYNDIVVRDDGPVYSSGSLAGNTNPVFWINPLTGLPMKESQEKGDYTFIPNESAAPDSFRVRGLTREFWPYLNQSGLQGDQTRSTSSSHQCCLFEIQESRRHFKFRRDYHLVLSLWRNRDLLYN